jgi:hypothetical protein
MSENPENSPGGSGGGVQDQGAAPAPEHLNIKVTDNNNEVFFKIKKSTKLEKLMTAFCERQGKTINSVRFLFEGTRVQPTDTPEAVSSSRERPTMTTGGLAQVTMECADYRSIA